MSRLGIQGIGALHGPTLLLSREFLFERCEGTFQGFSDHPPLPVGQGIEGIKHLRADLDIQLDVPAGLAPARLALGGWCGRAHLRRGFHGLTARELGRLRYGPDSILECVPSPLRSFGRKTGQVEVRILPAVRLEIGPLTSWIPSSKRTITAYAAQSFPQVFTDPVCALSLPLTQSEVSRRRQQSCTRKLIAQVSYPRDIPGIIMICTNWRRTR